MESEKKKKKKKKKGGKRYNKKTSALDRHNSYGYLNDLRHICKLGYINPSTRDWIETNMLRLRACANKYEIIFGEYLSSKKIEYIHQAPFIFSGKIYFADFYLPKHHLIIELDGLYHNGIAQYDYDRFRDACFSGHRVRVLRIPNEAVMNERDLKILTSEYF